MKDAYVHPMPMPVPMLQARRSPDEEFGTFYGSIEGFNWVEGHTYKLLIEELPREPYLMDAPTFYKLHKVISDTTA